MFWVYVESIFKNFCFGIFFVFEKILEEDGVRERELEREIGFKVFVGFFVFLFNFLIVCLFVCF